MRDQKHSGTIVFQDNKEMLGSRILDQDHKQYHLCDFSQLIAAHIDHAPDGGCDSNAAEGGGTS